MAAEERGGSGRTSGRDLPTPVPGALAADGTGGVVVVGVDGSPTSQRALAQAFVLAQGLRAELVAVTVAKLVASTGEMLGAMAAIEEATEEIADGLRRELASAAERTGVSAQLVVRRGSVLAELQRVAAEQEARMILVGASTSFGSRLIGALAPRVVRTGRWPVMVVP